MKNLLVFGLVVTAFAVAAPAFATTTPVTVTISNQTASTTALIYPYHANDAFQFRLTASGGDVYLSRSTSHNPAFASSSNAVVATIGSITAGFCTTGTSCGDTGNYFRVPDGASRVFYATGFMSNYGGLDGIKYHRIDRIYWGDDSVNLQEFNVSTGLDGLRVTACLGNGSAPETCAPSPEPTVEELSVIIRSLQSLVSQVAALVMAVNPAQ